MLLSSTQSMQSRLGAGNGNEINFSQPVISELRDCQKPTPEQQWKSLKTCFPWKDLSGMMFTGKPVLTAQLHEYLVLLGWGL